jgi:hypothetical protein
MSTDTTYTVHNLSVGAVVGLSLLGLVIAVIFFVAYIQIIRRAGYSGWWVLVMFVPVLNVVMLLVFAYKEWPIQRELRELRGWASQIQRGPGPQGPGYPSAGGPQDPTWS